jgi:hypothetical protein
MYEWIYKLASSEYTDTLLNIVGIAVTVILFCIGVKTVKTLYKEYSHRKERAVFNFYTHLSLFLGGFDFMITDNPEYEGAKPEPANVLYKIWAHEIYATEHPSSDDEVKRLNGLVQSFLNYMYTAPEQIPPEIKKDEFDKWLIEQQNLITELNKLLLETHNVPKSGPYDEDQVKTRYLKIKDTIVYFQEITDKALEEFRKECEEDSAGTNSGKPNTA